jgi:hypothetical protein
MEQITVEKKNSMVHFAAANHWISQGSWAIGRQAIVQHQSIRL